MRNFYENVSHPCEPKLITEGARISDPLDNPQVTSWSI